MIRRWLRWRRELAALRREASRAYDQWVRARYAYQDAAVIFGNQPGAWADSGPCGKAGDEETDRMNEYLELQRRVKRMEEVGPNG